MPLLFVYYTDIYSAVTQQHVNNDLFFDALILNQPPQYTIVDACEELLKLKNEPFNCDTG